MMGRVKIIAIPIKYEIPKRDIDILNKYSGIIILPFNRALEKYGTKLDEVAFVFKEKTLLLGFTPGYALDELSKRETNEFAKYVSEFLHSLFEIDESTQSSNIAHTPGSHKNMVDAEYEKVLLARIMKMRRFLGAT